MSKKNKKQSQTQPIEAPKTVEVEEQIVPELPAVEESEAQEIAEPVVTEVAEEQVAEAAVEEEPVAEEEIVEEKVIDEQPVEQEQPVVEEVVRETKVVKPVTNKGILKVEKKSAPVSAVVSIPQTEGVLKFNAIAKKYLSVMKPGHIDDEARRTALISLANMCNLVCMTSDPAVFDTCLRFFLENRSIMLAQSTVVGGIEKAVEKSKIAKILQFYTVFQTLVECKLLNNRFTLNITTIRRLLGNDALANWLIAKRG